MTLSDPDWHELTAPVQKLYWIRRKSESSCTMQNSVSVKNYTAEGYHSSTPGVMLSYLERARMATAFKPDAAQQAV